MPDLVEIKRLNGQIRKLTDKATGMQIAIADPDTPRTQMVELRKQLFFVANELDALKKKLKAEEAT